MKPGPQMLKIEARHNHSKAGEFTIVADPAVPGELRGHLVTAMWQLKRHKEDKIHEWSLRVTPVDSPRDRFDYIAPSGN